MIDICPTITSDNIKSYAEQMERIVPFAHRIHIDLADGVFTPNKLIDIEDVWWPGNVRADLHVMYKNPIDYLDLLIALKPQLIIVQAEANGEFSDFSKRVRENGIEAGVALLPETSPEIIKSGLEFVDHVLIFSGNLGHQGGGKVDFKLLDKVRKIKELKPSIEVSWDGGVDDQSAVQLVHGGVEVLNVGNFIQDAPDAEKAYMKLRTLI
jgi:ribulose-phosphate 3-epimerase